MGRDIAFETPAGSVSGWRADPVGAPRGALVVVQEIFGVNAHMRSVADRYAAAGLRGARAGVLRPGRARRRTGLRRRTASQGARRWSTALGLDRAVVDRPPLRRKLLQDEGLQGRRGRLLLGRHRGAAGQHAAGPAGGELLRRAQRALPRRAAARADAVPFRRPRQQHSAEDIALHRRQASIGARSTSTRPGTPSTATSTRRSSMRRARGSAHRARSPCSMRRWPDCTASGRAP